MPELHQRLKSMSHSDRADAIRGLPQTTKLALEAYMLRCRSSVASCTADMRKQDGGQPEGSDIVSSSSSCQSPQQKPMQGGQVSTTTGNGLPEHSGFLNKGSTTVKGIQTVNKKKGTVLYYARTQIRGLSIGTGRGRDNLEKAIADYSVLLHIRTQLEAQKHIAMTQQALTASLTRAVEAAFSECQVMPGSMKLSFHCHIGGGHVIGDNGERVRQTACTLSTTSFAEAAALWSRISGARSYQEKKRVCDDLNGQIVHRQKLQHWNSRYAELQKWLTSHGGDYPRQTADPVEKSLNHWVYKQQSTPSKLLNVERRQMLESLPGWHWLTANAIINGEPSEVKFQETFESLELILSRTMANIPADTRRTHRQEH